MRSQSLVCLQGAIDLPQSFYFLAVPNLLRVHYNQREHPELLILVELERRLLELPHEICCDRPTSNIANIAVVEIRLASVAQQAGMGRAAVRFDEFSPAGVTVVHHARLTFELFLIDGQLKILCAEIPPSNFIELQEPDL